MFAKERISSIIVSSVDEELPLTIGCRFSLSNLPNLLSSTVPRHLVALELTDPQAILWSGNWLVNGILGVVTDT